jgi:hypothetical protein
VSGKCQVVLVESVKLVEIQDHLQGQILAFLQQLDVESFPQFFVHSSHTIEGLDDEVKDAELAKLEPCHLGYQLWDLVTPPVQPLVGFVWKGVTWLL